MEMHRLRVMVPENHRATVEFPESIRSGPVDLIVLVPPEETSAASSPQSSRFAALAAELGQDSRPFDTLSAVERQERLRRFRGSLRGTTSGSEEFARRKLDEIDIEERKFGR